MGFFSRLFKSDNSENEKGRSREKMTVDSPSDPRRDADKLIARWIESSEESKQREKIEQELAATFEKITDIGYFRDMLLQKLNGDDIDFIQDLYVKNMDQRVAGLGDDGRVLVELMALVNIPNISLAGFVETRMQDNPIKGAKQRQEYKRETYETLRKRLFMYLFTAEERLQAILAERLNSLDSLDLLAGLFHSSATVKAGDGDLMTHRARDVVTKRICRRIAQIDNLGDLMSLDQRMLNYLPIQEASIAQVSVVSKTLKASKSDEYTEDLINASEKGDLETVSSLLAGGANPNGIGTGDWTPLKKAAGKGHIEIVRLLVENGADVNPKGQYEMTALHHAAARHHDDIVEYLLEQGADINAKNDEDETPLRWESKFGGNIDTCRLLVSRGADVDWEDMHGLTPLILAAGQDRRDAARLYLENGADVNKANRKGETALSKAVELGRTEIIEILKEHGASPQAPAPQATSDGSQPGGDPEPDSPNTIDCDREPTVKNMVVVSHRKGGRFAWDPERVGLFLSAGQKSGQVTGRQLLPDLEEQQVLNACVLDYLLANPELIPEDWKDKYVYFWGTIYRGALTVKYQFVRCLRWDQNKWVYDFDNLDAVWCSECPAAILRS